MDVKFGRVEERTWTETDQEALASEGGAPPVRGLRLVVSLVFAIGLILVSHLGDGISESSLAGRTHLPPGHLIILDVSGSMSGAKMEAARDAVRQVLDRHPEGVPIGLRLFATHSATVIEPGPGSADELAGLLPRVDVSGIPHHPLIRIEEATGGFAASMDWLVRMGGRPTSVGSGTSIHTALKGAGRDLLEAPESLAVHWILVSDGQSDRSMAVAQARELARRFPELRCETIGIELSSPGAATLAEVASILGGSSWNVNQRDLAATMVEAASLGSLTSFEKSAAGAHEPNAEVPGQAAWLCLLGGLFLAFLFRHRSRERAFLVALCVAAGAGAWFATEMLLPHHGTSMALLSFVQSAAYFMLAGVLFATALVAHEDLYVGNWRRAADQALGAFPLAVFGGALAGFAGQVTYLAADGALGESLLTGYVVRVAGWALAGALVGACPGAANRSRKLLFDGLLGGALGGAVGGAFFETTLHAMATAGLPRLLALVALAAAIAGLVRAVSELNKVAWFTLVKGGPEGKAYLLTKPVTFLGSHYRDDICVRAVRVGDPRREAMVRKEDGEWWVRALPGIHVAVNDEPTTAMRLDDGDVVQVGAALLRFGLARVSREDAQDPDRALYGLGAFDTPDEVERERKLVDLADGPAAPDIRFKPPEDRGPATEGGEDGIVFVASDEEEEPRG